jgi:hypothetical protein
MNIYPIGSISIFLNVSDQQNIFLDEELLEQISRKIEIDFKEQIMKYEFDVQFHINTSWKRGCIIQTITIGVILAGIYKFVIDYDKIRKNLKLITDDFKTAYLKIIRKNKNEEKKNLFSYEITIVRDSIEILNFSAQSDNLIILTETELLSIHKLCLMRDDLVENISEEEFQEFIKNRLNID